MKILFCLLLWGTISSGVYAQRVLPAKSKEQKRTEKQIEKKENSLRQKDTELRWDPRRSHTDRFLKTYGNPFSDS